MLVTAIHFPGTCAQAIAFYKRVFQAHVISVARYLDAPPGSGYEASAERRDWIMHAELNIKGTRINMSDVDESVIPSNMFLLNVFVDSVDEVKMMFWQLAEGGSVMTELAPRFFTPMYGEIVDRFGVHWQLMVHQKGGLPRA